MLFVSLALLVVGIILLSKGSDFFVDSGSEVGRVLRISEILLGVTVVSFGTSLPELIVAITGAQSGNNEIGLGNILGTNLFNVCIILGVICLIKPIKFLKQTVRKDMYMSAVSALVLFAVMADSFLSENPTNMISRGDGIVLLVMFGIFIYYTLYSFTDKKYEKQAEEKDEIKLKLKDIDCLTKNILIMIGSLIAVFIGARFTVQAVEQIALALKVSETLVSIIVLAVGTSLPEIFTSIAAIKKGKIDIAVGNLIGSGIFNILFILGIASVINPIPLEMDSLIIDALAFLLVSVLCIAFAKKRKEI